MPNWTPQDEDRMTKVGLWMAMAPLWVLVTMQIIVGFASIGDSRCDPLDNGVGIPEYLVATGFGKLVSGVFWVIFYRELFMPDDHGAGTILSTHRLRQMVYFLFSLEAVFIFYGFVVTFHSRLSESECPTFVHAFSVLTLVLLTIVTGFAILIPVMAGVPLEWHLPPPLHEAGAEGVITETELEAEESMEAGRMPTLAELGEEA